VVLHQSVRKETERKLGFTVGKVSKEPLKILFISKCPLSMVPSTDHMVESTVEMDSRSTSHVVIISKNDPCVNTELPKPDPNGHEVDPGKTEAKYKNGLLKIFSPIKGGGQGKCPGSVAGTASKIE
jgi:hypothetical protein